MAVDDKQINILLDERDLPTHRYNVIPEQVSPPSPVRACLDRSAVKIYW